MPTIAAATASIGAPATPACSKSGAKARPVAGPPVKVTEPASTPINGGWPSAVAASAPTTFWATATTAAMPVKAMTRGPPRRSSVTLAPNPTDVKKAIISGVCSVVSKAIDVPALGVEDREDHRDRKPADHGCRDVVAGERRARAV